MGRALVVALLMILPAVSGCLQDVEDGIDRLLAPRADVTFTPISEISWNRDGHFNLEAVYERGLNIGLERISLVDGTTNVDQALADDATLLADGTYRTTLDVTIPDGTWDLRVIIEERTWDRLLGVQIDSQAPIISGLERGGRAPDGSYILGQDASISDGTLEVFRGNGSLVGTQFPVTISNLDDGVHFIQVVATDQAGNRAVALVQVVAGRATDLPDGDATFGITSRYTIQAELWDIDRADAYLMPAEAREEAPEYLGAGFGVTPTDPTVMAVAEDVIHPSMTTMEAAFALYEWLYDELEYDDERLASRTLMLPRHVIDDTEDPDAEAEASQDGGSDGLSDDGPGNGVKGGVCRDLAGTYVSLLRAAGIPARLVTGYLAGTVDGFHAWVEVYVGSLDGQDPWMPVDVSPVDGEWDDGGGVMDRGPSTAMQAFGIRLPDYLPLRHLESEEEIKGWATAISAAFAYPADQDPPSLEFHKQTVDNFAEHGVMCVDTATYARQIATTPAECTFGDAIFGWDGVDATFTTASVQVIDYGVIIEDAAPGTSVDVQLAYPFIDEIQPVLVEYEVYGAPSKTTKYGTVTTTLDY